MIQIYNSLSRKKEEFIPLNKPKGKNLPEVNIYTCGVTVYDECHIGHARSLYIFDVIRNYLEYRKYKVNFVRNITDIDDKIINRANELKVDWKELVAKYIESYKKDLRALGIREGIVDKDGQEPRATKNIPEMIDYIKALIEKGHAYKVEGDVYFDVRRFADYGKLSGQDIEQMEQGARIEPAGNKRDPLDFALWKRSKEDEPSWDSPWGKGRPGWHIECSLMSQKFLKTDTLDIHAGGRDLIFPHHENEIAQAQAYTGKPFAKYWIHHGLLTINGQKMAKSLGNFITVKDALNKYSADALKIFYLQAHYSSPVDFSEQSMQEAATALDKLDIFCDKADRIEGANPKTPPLPSDQAFMDKIEALKEKFKKAMDEDFNTPQALGSLFEMLKEANRDSVKGGEILYTAGVIRKLGRILGLSLKQGKLDPKLEAYVKARIEERERARKQKDFNKSDQIRDELEEKGIVIEDTKEGTTWRPL